MLKKINFKVQVFTHVLIFLHVVTGQYEGRTEEVASLAILMLKMTASNTVPPFLTHTFDEVSK